MIDNSVRYKRIHLKTRKEIHRESVGICELDFHSPLNGHDFDHYNFTVAQA